MIDPGALNNRVLKTQRHLGKWARREGIEAFRLYDRDIPEFPLAIDRYADWLHVQVFEKKRALQSDEIDAIRSGLAQTLDIVLPQVVIKHRRRQRGLAQYEKLAATTPSFTVGERGLRFEVNLGSYLDTGLFLDHRDTRQMVRERAQDKVFLNLFAYTGSFTVYAAAGGARRSVTVDMSNTYQAWSRRNLVHNGLEDTQRHSFVQADVFGFIERMRAARTRFDLIVLDPPSFSNSKRMETTFDVQRDQLQLLRATVDLLTPGGELLFSTNRQGFRLDPGLGELAQIEEISARTIPEDFKRHTPHRCWLMTRD
ncbi:MAG: class I SAM-dependent methyltransferase [Gammaproteobacteria bacterium]|nr:class I SAM-dependent methyltransferase [Gammaproteobacteria bacterium]MCP5317362.1 class I SAM-dependent methyltransferase [Chromatiaceae bacterium]MCP5435873.1 class I SAM-dependent methyltransferase [Chromatiaceae bacterium]HOP16247.1 class I SAM-dependent methyltransferase [Gammaproteobacteria bacterium]HPQ24619.1 class I SAM-dependent methyltransferase [Gammaproteobacteria bacterium]